MKYFMIYITAKNNSEAKKISNFLLEKKLVACVNIIPKIESMYWWKGKIEKNSESAIVAKTESSLVDSVVSAVKRVHSYELPCILAVPIEKGNEDYLKWIGEVVAR